MKQGTKSYLKMMKKIAKLGGHATAGITSERKTESSQQNGKLGGRPKHRNPSKAALAKRASRARKAEIVKQAATNPTSNNPQ